jgi:hypothetical protein
MGLNLLELFKGTGSVGKVAKSYFDNIVSLDCDEKSKADITIDILKWNYKKFFDETHFIPSFIWASPPCNTYSPLSYPLKERNIETAEPISERAKLGTKILYRTLRIISFFKKINPYLRFVIENPKGMMRNDKRMKKLQLKTTLYYYYGDKRRKMTDFFSNFTLTLIQDGKTPKKISQIVDLPLNDRYKIPKQLIEHIFYDFFNSFN